MIPVKYLYPHWGSENLSVQDFFQTVLSNGFQGIEINMPNDAVFQKNFHKMLQEIRNDNPNFICGCQQVFGVKMETPDEYLEKVLQKLKTLLAFKPNFINSHTGKDYYSFSDNCKIIDAIEEFSIKNNIPVFHEIHRGRFTFHGAGTLKYLDVFPKINFVADFSHWCVVSESMLQDQEEILTRIIPRIKHIHARVGSEQTAQVSNPFAPEWDFYLQKFTHWWQQIVNFQRKQGEITITPEFGPFPYMPQMPFTKIPLANQKELNCKMKAYLESKLI